MEEFKDFLLMVGKATDDRLAATGTRLEPQYGIITMVLAANGGEMDEGPLAVLSDTLFHASQVAGITGRWPIYEFVAETLARVGR